MSREDNFKIDKTAWISKDIWLSKTWGKLVLKTNQQLPNAWGVGSHLKMLFDCLCGKSVLLEFKRVYSGNCPQKSCGHCNDKSKEYWLGQKWGKVNLSKDQELPDFFPPSTSKKFLFDCECGNKEKIDFKIITYGQKSCGHCNDKSKEYWLSQKWGDLVLDPKQNLPYRWNPFTLSKFNFVCVCGRKVSTQFGSVTSNNSTSCGHCNDKSKEYWLSQKWGKLMLSSDQKLSSEWGRGSNQKFNFVCDCTKTVQLPFNRISSNTSCGHCNDKSKEYWLSQKWGNLILVPSQLFPPEWSKASHKKFKMLCECGAVFIPNFKDITDYSSTNCGCRLAGRTLFSPAGKIFDFVKRIAPDAVFGYKLSSTGKEYDIYIPSIKLAIEYHGLIWHSEKFNVHGKRDYLKYKLSLDRQDRLIQIFGDEWDNKQDIIKNMLALNIRQQKQKRIKPKFSITLGKTSVAARKFLNQYHYLGSAGGCVTITAEYDNQIVGCWVFMKRNNNEIVWHRACVNHDFKMWNPHQSALNLAIPILKLMEFKKIVSFSDNRFHTGNLYSRLGFKFVNELKPDYGYTNGIKRYSKYNFRVLAGVNEKESAKHQGYYRIWDSGKKKFELNLN